MPKINQFEIKFQLSTLSLFLPTLLFICVLLSMLFLEPLHLMSVKAVLFVSADPDCISLLALLSVSALSRIDSCNHTSG